MLTWMTRAQCPGTGMSAVLGASDEASTSALHASKDELEEQHKRVIPTASPGDRMLKEVVS